VEAAADPTIYEKTPGVELIEAAPPTCISTTVRQEAGMYLYVDFELTWSVRELLAISDAVQLEWVETNDAANREVGLVVGQGMDT